MVPQYFSYGSAGVLAVPATIFMSVGNHGGRKVDEEGMTNSQYG